jgi:hypothetical protein
MLYDTVNVSIEDSFIGLYRLCFCGCKKLRKCTDGYGRLCNYIRGHANRILHKGEKHPNYGKRGAESTNFKGMWIHNDYIFLYAPKRPNCNVRGFVQLHRLIMEDVLGRYLTKEEVVHHIDGNRLNNFEENLELLENNIVHLTTKHKTTKDMSKRFCKFCGGKTYIRKNGEEMWFGNDEDRFACMKCYDKYIRNKNKKNVTNN